MAFPQGFRLKAGYYWRLGDRSGPYVVDKDGNARLVGGSGAIVPPPMVLDGWPKPAANVGESYLFYPVVVSGTGNKTFSVVSGSLPDGLSINASTGVVSGILTTAGSSTFSIRAVDANNEASTIGPFTVRVAATGSVLALYGDPVLNAAVGVPYSLQLGASGGVQPYIFAVASGTLPAGVSINSSTGLVSGTPTTAGTAANIVLRVTDAASETVSLAPFTITVAAAPATLTISGTPPTNATVGTAYSFTPTASGGVTPRTFSLVAGTLPAGLSFNTGTGAITGTPTAAGSATGLSIRVTDNVGAIATLASFSITVAAGVVAPGAPTGVSATAGDGSASVAFTAPASNGGAAITGYRVTASTGQTATGSASPITVPGLTNGTPVAFTVAAQNSVGYGAESAASSPVTPSAAAVTQALIATFGDSLTNRTWDTVPGGATLNASGGVATLTIPSRSDPMLPGDLIRLTGTTNRNSPFYGEWPIASKPNNTTITFNYPVGLGSASGLAFNISYGNAICVEGYVTNLINKSRQKISIVPSMASDGERTDEIYTRMQDKLPGLASSLQAVTIFAGINDISQGIAEATIIANIQALISYAAARVPFVVVYTIPASDTASSVRANVNAAIRAYVSANFTAAQVVVVDAATITESGAAGSVAKSGYLIDAVHISGNGAYPIGSAGWDALSTKYPALAAVSPAGVNRVANGNFTAVTGSTADGVTFVNAASHTNTPSIVANPNGGNFQQLQIVATATAGASRIERVLDLPSLTAGKRYRLWADCELVGTPVNAPDFNLAVVLDATGVTAYQGRVYSTGTGLGMGGTKQNWSLPVSLRGRGNWITWPAGVTDARIRLTLATVGAGTNTIRLGGVYFEEEA